MGKILKKQLPDSGIFKYHLNALLLKQFKVITVNKTTTKSAILPGLTSLLLLSFFEGACVMIAELAGGKMLAPYYGTSIYVWASTLSVTLGGLTLGYYLGGRMSNNELSKRLRILFLVISLAAGLVIIMPVWANYVMSHTLDFEFLTGLVFSQCCFLLLPIMGMGMVSPLIIGLIGENKNSGTAAGAVYAISTLGGIIATLLTGFWFIPAFGISIPCMVAGVVLLVAALIVLRPARKVSALTLLAIFPTIMFVKNGLEMVSEKYDLLYYSEGILGQIKVVEFRGGRAEDRVTTRNLLVNHNWQTWIDKDHPSLSFLYYTRFTNAVIEALPKGSNALLIGLGGGTVARQFETNNIAYDAVEIDGRLPAVAKKYFGLEGKGNIIVDDGRHYINKCTKKYDLVIIDALLGENIPSQLLSMECFHAIKNILKDDGRIFIEFDGIKKGESGKAQKLLYNTLVKSGYNCKVLSSVPNEQDADIMYFATMQPQNTDSIQVKKDRYYEFSGPLDQFAVTLTNKDDALLTDDKPDLDYLLRKRMAYQRTDVLMQANKAFLDNDMLFYY